MYKETVVVAFQKPSSGRSKKNNPQYLQQYSIQTLERVYKHYYFIIRGAELLLVSNACPMELNRLAQLRGRAYENMLAIATCNYPAPHPDCNGHSTLFDGVVYIPELPGSRDTCVFEADEGEGVYVAELDVDMLRDYRHREVWGCKNRRPELYGIISERNHI